MPVSLEYATSPPHAIARPLPWRRLTLALIAAFILLTIARLPIALDFKMFAFYDPGSALKADALLAAGQRPTLDFAYSYGLLTLAIGRAWFFLFGRTPWAYEALTMFCAALLMWAAARLAAALQWRWSSLTVFFLAMPLAFLPFYLNQAHAIEAALLVNAFAEQARGRRDRALALATLAAFIKPSMAYVYGLLLLIVNLRDAWQQRYDKGSPSFVHTLFPAAFAGAVSALILFARFGWLPLIHALLPLNAGKSYRAANFGFFHAGRDFWWRPFPEYFTTEAGFWIFSTLIMLPCGLWLAARQLIPQSRTTPPRPATLECAVTQQEKQNAREKAPRRAADETLLCMIVLHFVFIFFFYAWKDSWTYYSYLLVIAVASVLARLARVGFAARGVAWALSLILAAQLIAAQYIKPVDWLYAWRYPHNADLANLWTYEGLAVDWPNARAQVAGRPALWLVNGYLNGLFPAEKIQTPSCWFMSPSLQTSGEIARIHDQIAAAQVVVRWRELGVLDPWLWPEFGDQTRDFREEPGLQDDFGNRAGHFMIMVRTHPLDSAALPRQNPSPGIAISGPSLPASLRIANTFKLEHPWVNN